MINVAHVLKYRSKVVAMNKINSSTEFDVYFSFLIW
jgi:hypothetical protein